MTRPSPRPPTPARPIDLARIATRSAGIGRPLLFVHGWTMDHRDEHDEYEPIFAGRSGWRRLYFDLPGMGDSPVQRAIGSLDDMLDAVHAIALDLVGDERFCIAGTSAGAYLVRGLLHRLGDRVDGVLLRAPMVVPRIDARDVDPFATLLASAPHRAPYWRRRPDHGALIVERQRYAAALRRKLDERVVPAQAAADLVYLSMIRDDPDSYRFSFDVDVPVPLCAGPSLIVTGRQDVDVGYRDQWRLLMPQFPRATFIALDRAEHGLPIDQAGLYRALVDDWLDRVEESLAPG